MDKCREPVDPSTKFDIYGDPCCGYYNDCLGGYIPDSYLDSYEGPPDYPDRSLPGFAEWRERKIEAWKTGGPMPEPFPPRPNGVVIPIELIDRLNRAVDQARAEKLEEASLTADAQGLPSSSQGE